MAVMGARVLLRYLCIFGEDHTQHEDHFHQGTILLVIKMNKPSVKNSPSTAPCPSHSNSLRTKTLVCYTALLCCDVCAHVACHFLSGEHNKHHTQFYNKCTHEMFSFKNIFNMESVLFTQDRLPSQCRTIDVHRLFLTLFITFNTKARFFSCERGVCLV